MWYSVGGSGGLSRVKAFGGAPEVFTTPDRKAGEKTHRFPAILPGGRAVVFTSAAADLATYSDARIVVRDMASGAQHTLVEGGVNAQYVSPGFLVYAKAASIYAVAFDATSLAVTGVPVEIQTNVSMTPVTGAADFALSTNGLLVYAPGGEYTSEYRMVWVDRQGRTETILERMGANYAGVLSPDQRSMLAPVPRANDQVVNFDLSRKISNALTTTWDAYSAAWSEDGQAVFVLWNKGREYSALFSMPATGGDAALLLDQGFIQIDRQARGDTLAAQVLGARTRDGSGSCQSRAVRQRRF